MQAHLQRFEREMPIRDDHQFAVDDEAALFCLAQRRDDLREIPPQGLAGFRAQIDLVAIAEGQAAEPIPFRLELPSRAVGQFVGTARFHRRGGDRDAARRPHGQHRNTLALSTASICSLKRCVYSPIRLSCPSSETLHTPSVTSTT